MDWSIKFLTSILIWYNLSLIVFAMTFFIMSWDFLRLAYYIVGVFFLITFAFNMKERFFLNYKKK